MKILYPTRFVLLSLCFIAITHASEESPIDTDINVQGFGGLINVPSAKSIQYGEFYFSYSDLSEYDADPDIPKSSFYRKGNIFTVSASPFPGVEATVRNSGEYMGGYSDLQANLKYQATFIPREWFDVAVGYQDIGGITNHLDSVFIVFGKDWNNFRFTAGTGQFKSTRKMIAKRYEGGFYGVQYQPFDWLQFQVENDGVNNAAAVKFKTPTAWFDDQMQLYGSLIKGDYDDGTEENNLYFQLGIRANLFQGFSSKLDSQNYKTQQLGNTFGAFLSDRDYGSYIPEDIDYTRSKYYDDNVVAITSLKDILVEHGFEDVWVGAHNNRLFLRLENSLYTRNPLDALGVILGITSSKAPGYISDIDVTFSRYGIPNLRLSVGSAELNDFYEGRSVDPLMRALTPVTRDEVLADWVGANNTPWLKPRVTFSPVLTSFIGTEIGQADISMSMRSQLNVPLWTGAEVTAGYDINISNSDDYDLGRSLWKFRRGSGLKSLVLNQTYQFPYDIYLTGSAGWVKERYNEEHNLAALQATWQSNNGQHRLSYHYGYLDSDLPERPDRIIFSGEYRHYYRLSIPVSMSKQVNIGEVIGESSLVFPCI